MDDIVKSFIYPQLRKLIYGACMSWIAILLEWAKVHNIPITEAIIDNWISILLALAGMALTALWTWLKNKLTAKVAVTIPAGNVQEVKSIVGK